MPIPCAIQSCPSDPFVYPDLPSYPSLQGSTFIRELHLEGTKEEREKQEADLQTTPQNEITHTTEVQLYRKEPSSPQQPAKLTVNYWHSPPGTDKKKWITKRVYSQLSPQHPYYRQPFGTKLGFHTNLGTIQPPNEPVKGYIYTEDTGWILHATAA